MLSTFITFVEPVGCSGFQDFKFEDELAVFSAASFMFAQA